MERERAQDRANESKMLMESAFSGLSEAVFLVDVSTRRIVSCNQSASRMFGYPVDELIGEQTERLFEDEKSFKQFIKMLALVR